MANNRLIGSVLFLGVVFSLTLEGCGCGGKGSGGGGTPPGPVPGPSSWYTQYRQPTSSNLRAVRAADANTVIVAGEATSIFRSDNAGQTWVQIEHRPVSRGGDIVSMDFFNAHLECVGPDSKIAGKGRVWTAINGVLDFSTPDLDATVASYVCVDVVSDDTYYALRSDRVVEKNVAGVVTLLPVLPAGTWNSISFIGITGVGYAAGDGGLIAQYTGGISWTPQATPASPLPAPNPQYNLKKIFFFDANNGFACGDFETILRTTNAGTTWLLSNYAGASAIVLHSLHFPVDALTGWVVGDGGLIGRTTNGGATYNASWFGQSSPTPENLWDVWFTDANSGYIVGDHGIVLRTITAGVFTTPGTGWLRAPPGANGTDSLIQLNAVDFSNDGSLGLVAGNTGLLLRTLDGGTTWESLGSLGTPEDLLSVAIPKGPTATGDVAYASGGNGVIIRSADVRAAVPTWTLSTVGAGAPKPSLNAILFPAGDNTGCAVGNSAGLTMYFTINGTSWSQVTGGSLPATTTGNWLALGADAGGVNTYAAGDGGKVAHSANLGSTWVDFASPGAVTINAFQAPTTGAILYAAAGDGKVYKNTGAWAATPGNLPAGVPLSMSFTDPLSGWTVNSPVPFTGGASFTTDGGASWNRAYVHTKWQLRSVWASPIVPGLVYAVGDNGTILKTTTGGQ